MFLSFFATIMCHSKLWLGKTWVYEWTFVRSPNTPERLNKIG